MQVRHDEGVATHIGPEPCADAREGVGEASVGEHAGQPLSREIASSRMHGSSLRGNREISGSAPTSSIEGVVRSGKARSRSRR